MRKCYKHHFPWSDSESCLCLLMHFYIHLLCQPLCHSLVICRLSLPRAHLWLLPVQAREGVFGAVTVGVCEATSTSCREKQHEETQQVRQWFRVLHFSFIQPKQRFALRKCYTLNKAMVLITNIHVTRVLCFFGYFPNGTGPLETTQHWLPSIFFLIFTRFLPP